VEVGGCSINPIGFFSGKKSEEFMGPWEDIQAEYCLE